MNSATKFIVPDIWGAHGSRTQILIKKQNLAAHGAFKMLLNHVYLYFVYV